ncbi:hypothetical protein NKH18_21540 [Streptomyces sp. M10(2022)]
MLARHLADRGHAVLVVDLDLESPGAGPLLMGRNCPGTASSTTWWRLRSATRRAWSS